MPGNARSCTVGSRSRHTDASRLPELLWAGKPPWRLRGAVDRVWCASDRRDRGDLLLAPPDGSTGGETSRLRGCQTKSVGGSGGCIEDGKGTLYMSGGNSC